LLVPPRNPAAAGSTAGTPTPSRRAGVPGRSGRSPARRTAGARRSSRTRRQRAAGCPPPPPRAGRTGGRGPPGGEGGGGGAGRAESLPGRPDIAAISGQRVAWPAGGQVASCDAVLARRHRVTVEGSGGVVLRRAGRARAASGRAFPSAGTAGVTLAH